ncbi:MAG: Uma2 family endonuclease [Deltaproteobacteria bacterium]|nr:Uma2 family endonuclease [Deltaproteobacteria bacterium]
MVGTLQENGFPSWLTPPPSADQLPTEDGEPFESKRHRQATILLSEPLELFWATRDDFFVGSNMFVYFSAIQAKRNDFRGPDVFVVLDTDRRERQAWVVWEENGKSPDLVIELLSPSTEADDRGRKRQIYERAMRVGEYFLFDPFTGILEGLRLDGNGVYRPIPVEPSGRMKSARTGLELGVWVGIYHGTHAPWLRWFTADGSMLPSDEDLKAHAAAEAARAQTEAARAEAARDEAKAARDEAKAAKDEVAAERKRREELEALVASLTSRTPG